MNDIQDVLRGSLAHLDLNLPVTEIQRRARWARLRYRTIPLAAVVALVLAITVSMQALAPTPSAASALESLASAAEKTSWVAPKPGQVWYSRSQSFGEYGTGGWTGYETQVGEHWIAPDGSGRIVLTVQPGFVFFSEADRQKWEDSGGRSDGEAGIADVATYRVGDLAYNLGCCAITIDELLAMRDRPAEFSAKIQEAASSAGPSPAEEAWTIFTDLAPAPLPPEMRATLYRTVAEFTTGVSYLGEVTDPLGRHAIGFARSEGSTREVVLFDESSGAYLGRETMITKPVPARGLQPGDVTDYNVVLTSGWVDSTEAEPIEE